MKPNNERQAKTAVDSDMQPIDTTSASIAANPLLAEALIVGAKIKIGKQYADKIGGLDEGEIITLIEGHFEYDNGLYTEDQTAPAIWNVDDFDSIYHLFGNNLEDFMDCEVVS